MSNSLFFIFLLRLSFTLIISFYLKKNAFNKKNHQNKKKIHDSKGGVFYLKYACFPLQFNILVNIANIKGMLL
jgi:hypothetical protein